MYSENNENHFKKISGKKKRKKKSFFSHFIGLLIYIQCGNIEKISYNMI
jgi:hypothetical protein